MVPDVLPFKTIDERFNISFYIKKNIIIKQYLSLNINNYQSLYLIYLKKYQFFLIPY